MATESPLRIESTPLGGLKILRQMRHADARGALVEAWHRTRFEDLGLASDFVQDNVVSSRHGVLRGLHYQYPKAQLKLVSVVHGEVFDVVVDIRRYSSTYGQSFSINLSAENAIQLWIEAGFAHGYQVLSNFAVLCYKCSQVYDPASDSTVHWADPAIGIRWPLPDPILSRKDEIARRLKEIPDTELFSVQTAIHEKDLPQGRFL